MTLNHLFELDTWDGWGQPTLPSKSVRFQPSGLRSAMGDAKLATIHFRANSHEGVRTNDGRKEGVTFHTHFKISSISKTHTVKKAPNHCGAFHEMHEEAVSAPTGSPGSDNTYP